MALAIADRKGIEVLCQPAGAMSKEENFISGAEKAGEHKSKQWHEPWWFSDINLVK